MEGIDCVEFTVHREGYVGDWNHDDIVDEDLLFSLKDGERVGDERLLISLVWGHQVSYAPEVITVNEMTLNPRTDELEYCLFLTLVSIQTQRSP